MEIYILLGKSVHYNTPYGVLALLENVRNALVN
jgi:hypothetical protein